MKIALISSSSGSKGGGERFLLYLGQGLAARGHEATLWTSEHPRMDDLAAEFAPIGPVRRFAYRNTYDYRTRTLATSVNRAETARLAALLRNEGTDVYHLNKQNLEDGLDLLRAVNVLPGKRLCTVHMTQTAAYLGARGSALRDFLSRRQLQRFTGDLVAVEETRGDDLKRFLGPTFKGKIEVVPNGVPKPDASDLARWRTEKRLELGLSAEEKLVIGVGRMVAQKRPLLFLETAGCWAARGRPFRYLWIGDGDMAGEWDTWISQNGQNLKIARLPWQPDVRPYLAAADVMLHVAAFEGMPLAVLEAMACGLPVAMSEELKTIRFFDRHENAFFWVRPGGTPAFEAADVSARVAIASALFDAELDTRQMAARYEALYQV